MKAIFTTLSLLICLSCLYSQSYWKSYQQAEGLLDSNIIDISATENNVYLATPLGLSIFNRSTEQFQNFDTSNSSLSSQNVLQVKANQDTAYLLTDSGLSVLRNNQIFNLDTTNGLFGDSIREIELNSKGELVVASFAGVLLLKSTTVDTLSTTKTYSIGVNSGDSIYAIINSNVILNQNNPVTCEVYDGSAWQAVADLNLSVPLLSPKLKQLSNGKVGIMSSNNGVYVIDSIFNLRNLPTPSFPFSTGQISDFDLSSKGDYWVAHSDFNPYSNLSNNLTTGIYRCDSSNCDTIFSGLPSIDVSCIQLKGGKVFIGTNNGFAQTDDSLKNFPYIQSLSTSSLEAKFRYNGISFNNSDRDRIIGGLTFPKGTNKQLIFSQGIWNFGKTQAGDSMLAVQSYSSGDYVEGTINNNSSAIRSSMIKINRSDVSFHLKNYQDPNYEMPESIKNWPANGRLDLGEATDQAPFVDVDNDGCYNPSNGDYPYFLGDKALYIVFNDAAQPRTGFFTKNMNIEVHLTAYVFDRPQLDFLNNSVFLRYRIVNRANQDYEMKTGIFQDSDLGNYLDDYVGSIPAENIVYSYNGDDNDSIDFQSVPFAKDGGYNRLIPAVGTKFINTKLGSFMKVNYAPLLSSNVPYYHYRAFDKKWTDGTPMTYGGSGYDINSTDTISYMFPGDPRVTNEWSELNPGIGSNPIPASDRISFFTIPPYQLKAGESKIIDLVIGAGIDSTNTNYLDNIDVMVNNLNRAANYQEGVDSIAPKFTYSTCTVGIEDNKLAKESKSPELYLYPNPSNGELNIIANHSMESIQLFDLQGRIVQTIKLDQAQEYYSIKLRENLPNGMYIVRGITPEGKSLSERLLLQR